MINITIVAHLCIWTYIHVYIPCTCISRSGTTRDRLSAYFFSQRTYIVLKTFKLTPNCMLYEDTGSIDMTTQVHKKMVNFWLKNKIQFRWEISLCFMPISFKLKFRGTRTPQFQVVQKKMKNTLNYTGFSDAWYAQSMDLEYFKTIFAQRSNDIFMQKWFEDMSGNSQCSTWFHRSDENITCPCVQRVKLEINPIIYLNVYSLKKTGKS